VTAEVVTRAVRAEAPARAAVEQAGRSPELDGIRAVAIWLVLIVHLVMQGGAAQAGAALHGPARAAFLAVSHMWLGVDLFFVLSGFLITGILWDTKGSPGAFRLFHLRRALRIFPLYYGALAIVWRFITNRRNPSLARELMDEGGIEVTGPPALHGMLFNGRVSRRDHVALFVVRNFRPETALVSARANAAHGFFALDALPHDPTAGPLDRPR